MDTLVLDTQGFPVAFVTWQRAVNLYFQDRATVVTDDAERILRSSSFEMGLPRVIRLQNHISRKLRLKVPMRRRNIAIGTTARASTAGACWKLGNTRLTTLCLGHAVGIRSGRT